MSSKLERPRWRSHGLMRTFLKTWASQNLTAVLHHSSHRNLAAQCGISKLPTLGKLSSRPPDSPPVLVCDSNIQRRMHGLDLIDPMTLISLDMITSPLFKPHTQPVQTSRALCLLAWLLLQCSAFSAGLPMRPQRHPDMHPSKDCNSQPATLAGVTSN